MNSCSGPEWERIFRLLRERLGAEQLPSVSEIALRDRDPFRVLVSTIISLRTRDEVTTSASGRLFARAADAGSLADLPEEEIERLIHPAGFYRTKARTLREVSRILRDRFEGSVPADREELLSLPGVGRKTANLVLGLGFGVPAICVDTHVHRIANRTGWIRSRTPEETEMLLQDTLPRSLWIEANGLLVRFGQLVCTPLSPHCSGCPLSAGCPRNGVDRSR